MVEQAEGLERRLRLAVASLRVGGDLQHNLRRVQACIAQASEAGAELVCLPEYCLNPVMAHWVDLEAPIQTLCSACRRHQIWAVLGAERGGPDARRNCVLLLSPDGAVQTSYDKVHLWGRERRHFLPGTDPAPVVDIGHCRLGLICCWDIAFPSDVANLATRGAEMILCPSRLVDYQLDAEPLRALPLARAFENLVYFVLCDALSDNALADDTLSECMICHPLGIRHRIARSEGMLIADLDLNALAELRAYYGGDGREDG
jgi:predicted amidohydrolase